MANNRIQSANQYLFVSKGNKAPTDTHGSGDISELVRIQNININANVSRLDIGQFGQMARIGTLVVEPPTSEISYSYLLHNGYNEKQLGFSFSNDFSVPFTSEVLDTNDFNDFQNGVKSGVNYHILFVPNGNDAVNYAGPDNTQRVVSIGNAFTTEISFDFSVGEVASVSVNAEGMITNSILGTSGQNPSIDLSNGLTTNTTFTLPIPAVSNDVDVIALRPGDIQLSFPNASRFTQMSDLRSVQSVNITLPMSRSTLQGLGSTYGYAKEIDLPADVSLSISMLGRDFKSGNLNDEIINNPFHTFDILLNDTQGAGIIAFRVKNAQYEGESFSSAIGDNQTVDLKFSTQITSPQDNTVGLFASGSF